MDRQIHIRPRAEADISEARDWYDHQRVGLGDEFLACVADSIARLEQRADQFPDYYQGFRRILTPRFPYKVFYRIESELVIVFRALHAVRNHPDVLDQEK